MVWWREFNPADAKDVLGRLKLRGVQIKLDGESHTNVIKAIRTFLNRYDQSTWSFLTADITGAIRREFLKSRNVIDSRLVTEFVEHLEKEEEEFKQKQAARVEEEDSDVGSEEEEESDFDDSEDDDDEGNMEVVTAKEEEIDDLKDPRTRRECIKDLLFLAREEGMSVNKGDEEAILEMMIPYIRESISYADSIEDFLLRLREYIDRCSTLDSLETVETALQSLNSNQAYEAYKVKTRTSLIQEEDMTDASKDQLSKKNLVSTKEEGIATPMNQIKQEEIRECGDIMETEEKETSMIPLSLADLPKENMGNAYSCIKESLERAGSNKRKLAQV